MTNLLYIFEFLGTLRIFGLAIAFGVVTKVGHFVAVILLIDIELLHYIVKPIYLAVDWIIALPTLYTLLVACIITLVFCNTLLVK